MDMHWWKAVVSGAVLVAAVGLPATAAQASDRTGAWGWVAAGYV
ncbi:hypothetical protein ABT294_38965 [Nonomuraea sp. NPDC000554]